MAAISYLRANLKTSAGAGLITLDLHLCKESWKVAAHDSLLEQEEEKKILSENPSVFSAVQSLQPKFKWAEARTLSFTSHHLLSEVEYLTSQVL